MRMKSCFFIGHREADERLLPALKNAIEQLIAEDVSYFYVGGYSINQNSYVMYSGQLMEWEIMRLSNLHGFGGCICFYA